MAPGWAFCAVWSGLVQFGPGLTQVWSRFGQGCAFCAVWSGLDRFGPVWAGLGRSGPSVGPGVGPVWADLADLAERAVVSVLGGLVSVLSEGGVVSVFVLGNVVSSFSWEAWCVCRS